MTSHRWTVLFVGGMVLWSSEPVHAQLLRASSEPPPNQRYDVLAHQERAMGVLLAWSIASLTSGGVLLAQDSRVLRDFGIQNIAWGAVDGVIALVAGHSLRQKRLLGYSPEEEREQFRHVLLINTALDVVYVGVGAWMVSTGRESLRGHGYGVLLQGSFLLIFDGINYLLTL